MANCCICGSRIGRFGEDKYDLKDGLIACYQCAPLFRKMQKAERLNQLAAAKDAIRAREHNMTEAAKEAVKYEFERIRVIKKFTILRDQLEEEMQEEITKKDRDYKVTTGYNFEGYKIVNYIDVVHGEVVLGTVMFSEFNAAEADIFGRTSSKFGGKLSKAKIAAQAKMVASAIVNGANAVIGLDFDITTLQNNTFVVSVVGTAVVIERLEE